MTVANVSSTQSVQTAEVPKAPPPAVSPAKGDNDGDHDGNGSPHSAGLMNIKA